MIQFLNWLGTRAIASSPLRIWSAYIWIELAVARRQQMPSHTIPRLQGETSFMRMIKNNRTALLTCQAVVGMALFLGGGTAPASAATISRSADVKASAAAVWSLIGPFCAIKDWLPPVGQCIEDGKTPPTRILVTTDGKAAFVETQTARNEAGRSYSYRFLSSPLPVSNYTSTIKVTAKRDGSSTVTWSGSYTPDHGKEKAANEALSGVYEAGLAQIGRLAR